MNNKRKKPTTSKAVTLAFLLKNNSDNSMKVDCNSKSKLKKLYK